MSKINAIGIETSRAKNLAEKLNALLANYSLFYQNTRGYHWNIQGEKFFELHVKFEELYNNLLVKIDEVAERILTLGYAPEHKYSNYAKISLVKESAQVSDGKKAVENIVKSLSLLISFQRDLLALSAEPATREPTP